jgi:hypothetical protein
MLTVKEEPAVGLDGEGAETENCAAGPVVMLKLLLVAEVRLPSIAFSLYPVPVVLSEQPAKVMTPFVSVCEQPESVPGPPEVGVPVAIERVAVETLVVTALPN